MANAADMHWCLQPTVFKTDLQQAKRALDIDAGSRVPNSDVATGTTPASTASMCNPQSLLNVLTGALDPQAQVALSKTQRDLFLKPNTLPEERSSVLKGVVEELRLMRGE
jgi:hypothetical protein